MKRRAFTLVELLVVVTIIGMLVSLLMPALLASRGRARIAQCVNNQHELSLAIIQYDVAKNHLPGALNRVGGAPLGLAPVLFPFLGKSDLWEGQPDKVNPLNGVSGWRSGMNATPTPPATRIGQFVCPDDNDDSVMCALSYVGNLGLYNDSVNSTFQQNGETGIVAIPGIFRNYSVSTAGMLSMSSVKSASQTVMLSEKRITLTSEKDDFVPAMPIPGRQWTDTDFRKVGFSWPNFPPLPAPAPQPDSTTVLKGATIGLSQTLATVKYWAPLPPIHTGIVLVTFCDGHTETISDDVEAQVYRAIP